MSTEMPWRGTAPIPSDDEKTVIQNAMWTHVAPFGAWLLLMSALPSLLPLPAAWTYAVRTAIGLGLFLWFCPWRWYAPLRLRSVPLAVIVGVVVFVVWVLPEASVMDRLPRLRDLYQLVGITPPWKMPEPLTETPYAPEVCGWPLTLIRIAGSAFVIAFIEEFFWRGFLYRWMFKSNFLSVDPGLMHKGYFIAIAVFFGLEHTQWLVGIFAGLAYGWLMIRTRDIWAASLAHVLTNLLLGIYVVLTRSYQFW